MSDLLNDFQKPSFDTWKEKLISDLKGKSDDLLLTQDLIEGIDFPCFQHADQKININLASSNHEYVRNTWKSNNSYLNCATIYVCDCATANKEALEVLNLGANAIKFVIESEDQVKSLIFEGVELQYIHTTIQSGSSDVILAAFNLLGKQSYIDYQFDAFESNQFENEIKKLLPVLQTGTPVLSANGFALNSIGSNTSEELAYQLNVGHLYLFTLLENGLTVDEATATIRFDSGIGANYFYDLAKFKILRLLWKKVVDAYHPQHDCAVNAIITATSGFVNKSIKDPYTNLLRQTTEAMSAICAGVNSISILPYDLHGKEEVSALSKRMAINIPTILSEESYLDKVVDPYGGSYTLDLLMDIFSQKAWGLFQELEQLDAIDARKNFILERVRITKLKRIDQIKTGEKILIGVNKFSNIDSIENEWQYSYSYLGEEGLVLEKMVEKIEA